MARNVSEAKKAPDVPTLKCPHCDNDTPEDFEFYEDVLSIRSISGFNDHGQLLVSSESKSDWDGANPRLCCLKCWAEFALPEGNGIEWD